MRRLILCLDGTWNNRDDNTNVLHHFGMVREGDCSGVFQKKYYQEGVGTGPLDGITGGGFGFGLEQHVRNAYNWLVENFQDTPPDEIYIFGFSRGAFTARSLVGFISRYGLLKRGAPLTVNQLWDEYCLLSREREKRHSFWDVLGKDYFTVRPINELKNDPWDKRRRELPEPDNDTERLLVHWSDRVRITYLGIYDTVGAVGWDALAIPGLESMLALHHNVRPTSIVRKCRHALAIDEHRSSFRHTPFLQYAGHADPAGKKEEPSDENEANSWHEEWNVRTKRLHERIEQRWFVGAHSNVGGGYANNELAQVPFRWMMEGAVIQGLHCENFSAASPINPLQPRDSYSEFAKPLWALIFRAKRSYRQIDPPDDVRAATKEKRKKPGTGYSLRPVNEQMDESVVAFYANNKPLPPNLAEYIERRSHSAPAGSPVAKLKSHQPAMHQWISNKTEEIAIVLWTALAGFGIISATNLFLPGVVLSAKVVCVVAMLFAVIDWIESRVNFDSALKPSEPSQRAWLDSIYWPRALGVILFGFGLVYGIGAAWRLGWTSSSLAEMWSNTSPVLYQGAVVLVACVLCARVVSTLNGSFNKSRTAAPEPAALPLRAAEPLEIPGTVQAIFIGLGAIALLSLAGWLAAKALAPVLSPASAVEPTIAPGASLAGTLLLVQFAAIYFLTSVPWVGAVMSKANLGSQVSLQKCFTPNAVAAQLESWRQMLVCVWNPHDKDKTNGPAAVTMRRIVGESLWRDVLGFVPIYCVALCLGLWFAAEHISWAAWLNKSYFGARLWFWIPVAGAVADWIENLCHLHYLNCHAEKNSPAPSGLVTAIAIVMTGLKFAAFFFGLGITFIALCLGTLQCIETEGTGWRGAMAISIFVFEIAAIALFVCAIVYRRFLRKSARRKPREQAGAAAE